MAEDPIASEKQPSVPEEGSPSYMDALGSFLKFMFPKTAFAKERVAEGLVSSVNPWGYKTDLTEAREKGGIAAEVPVVAEKTARFIQGALGFGGDYTDEVAKNITARSNLQTADRRGPLGKMADLALNKQPDFDITDIVKASEDTQKRARIAAETRIDLLALGLGRPQRYGHLVESKDRPSIGETDPTSEYLDFREGLGFKERGLPKQTGSISAKDMRHFALGQYARDRNPDYESYYDRWDFAGKKALGKLNDVIEALGLYKPREIYGRIPRK